MKNPCERHSFFSRRESKNVQFSPFFKSKLHPRIMRARLASRASVVVLSQRRSVMAAAAAATQAAFAPSSLNAAVGVGGINVVGRRVAAPGLAPVRLNNGFNLTTSSTRQRPSVLARGLKTGIVGLPNVGKSTLFNAICENGKAQAANFPFCTIEPNVGVVAVPDERLSLLSEISKSQAIVPTSVEFVDIAGLVKGASKGEGLGNQFLANIRECDAVVHVVRCFDDENVIHVSGKVDPAEDASVINFELALADYAQVEKRLERIAKGGRSRTKEEVAVAELEVSALRRSSAALEEGRAARSVFPLESDDEGVIFNIRALQLLTAKPMVYAANVAESDLADAGASSGAVAAVRRLAEAQGSRVVVVSAQVEAELRELEPEEAAEYLQSLGVESGAGGLAALIRATYGQLGLQTYYTTGEKETRAWTVRVGATAPQAAGVIHTDFEKGFIRAETVAFDDFVSCGGMAKAKEAGKVRLEGKEYVVADADIMNFRFAN